MTIPEVEKSLRFVINEAMKSNIHPIQITGTLDILKFEIQSQLFQRVSQLVPDEEKSKIIGGKG